MMLLCATVAPLDCARVCAALLGVDRPVESGDAITLHRENMHAAPQQMIRRADMLIRVQHVRLKRHSGVLGPGGRTQTLCVERVAELGIGSDDGGDAMELLLAVCAASTKRPARREWTA